MLLARWLISTLLIGLTVVGSDPAQAQPTKRDYREPREAPPPVRVETQAPRANMVWIPGRWQWKAGKWDWIAGHFERERAGKKWREGRWTKKGDVFVYADGTWIDDAPAVAPSPYPRDAPPPLREEKLAPKAGMVWVRGHWEWKNKWEWIPGHFERERAGKKWRDGRWDKSGDRFVWVAGDWIDAPNDDFPREAPPALREEKFAPKPGMVWIRGRYEWKARKWEWIAGHFERERAGKQFRDGRWDKTGDRFVYVQGDWIDAPNDDYPREAPPALREEKFAPKPGMVWIRGRFEWKARKWEWIPGHFERERAGKQWREGRWDRNGDRFVYVEGDWTDAPAGGDYPRDAPPALRDEPYSPKPGMVWVRGRWDWRANKWEWIAGHFERERAGKKWREGRWDRNGDRFVFVEGDWIDEGGEPDIDREPRRPRRDWKLDRPTVGSYWPVKGKAGTRVVIRGRNFGPETTVLWDDEPLRGARVQPDEIGFVIPATAKTGEISLRTGRGRELPVGSFEVAATFDAVAEQRKLEEEQRKAAELAVAARQKQLAAISADRAARAAAFQKRAAERVASREQRRSERLAALRAKWDRAFLGDAETQGELTLHAQRMADLLRMREVAELTSNNKLAVRVEVALSRETVRHEDRMGTLKAAFKGGKP